MRTTSPAANSPFAARHARRQEAPAIFAQGLSRAVIDKERPFGVMEKGDPAFAPRQLGRLRDEHRPLLRPFQNAGQDGLLFARGDDHRDARPHHHLGRLQFGGHAAHGRLAVGAARHFFHRRVQVFDQAHGAGIGLAEIFDQARPPS